MIQETDLNYFRNWFDMYVKQFCTGNERIDSAICLKVKHTKNVVREILDIADTVNLDAETRSLAEIVALFHDIGRFKQYIKYGTYSDQKSEDHAKIGLDVIAHTGVFSRLPTYKQELIRNVIANHNRMSLPHSNDQKFLLLLKLLRDADKIDIFHVVIEHYAGINHNAAINISLSDAPEISDTIINCIRNGSIANVADMKTINDFKLLQISWIFDLNFPRTYTIFNQRRYLENLSEFLPKTADVVETIDLVNKYLQQKCIIERCKIECQIP